MDPGHDGACDSSQRTALYYRLAQMNGVDSVFAHLAEIKHMPILYKERKKRKMPHGSNSLCKQNLNRRHPTEKHTCELTFSA